MASGGACSIGGLGLERPLAPPMRPLAVGGIDVDVESGTVSSASSSREKLASAPPAFSFGPRNDPRNDSGSGSGG